MSLTFDQQIPIRSPEYFIFTIGKIGPDCFQNCDIFAVHHIACVHNWIFHSYTGTDLEILPMSVCSWWLTTANALDWIFAAKDLGASPSPRDIVKPFTWGPFEAPSLGVLWSPSKICKVSYLGFCKGPCLVTSQSLLDLHKASCFIALQSPFPRGLYKGSCMELHEMCRSTQNTYVRQSHPHGDGNEEW